MCLVFSLVFFFLKFSNFQLLFSHFMGFHFIFSYIVCVCVRVCFVFWNFESLIFFLSFWGFPIFLCEGSQVRKWGMCFFSCELWKFFVFVFWDSRIFNFFIVILGVFQIFCVKFSQARKWGMCLFSCEFWKFSIFVFWNFKIFNFLLVILEVSHGGK